MIRRFKELIKTMPNGVQLPEVIAIDEYKADTDEGKYQLIIPMQNRLLSILKT